jgi:cysteinyl-tRNA synthetase
MLSTHYRKQLKFTWASLAQAEEAVRRIADFLAPLDTVADPGAHPATVERVESARASFKALLEDDLNTACGLGVVFELVRSLNTAIDGGDVGQSDLPPIRTAFDEFDRVLGVMALWRAEDADLPVPAAEIGRLIAERQAARRNRDFRQADRIRDDLAARGVLLEDSAAGTRWKRK